MGRRLPNAFHSVIFDSSDVTGCIPIKSNQQKEEAGVMCSLSQGKKNVRFLLTAAALSAVIASPYPAGAETNPTVAKCINDIKSGPSVYYTPEAASYYSSLGNYTVSGSSTDKEAAQRSFKACVKLSQMTQGEARDAIPVLIDYFPRAVHVVLVRNASFSYGDQGSYDDCVSTYVMNAKNQVLLSSPFLDYGTLSLCENFIESSYETEVLSQQFNAKGVIVQAAFNLKIFLNFYAGECALSRLTGMSLGHDPSAWRQSWQVPSSTAPNFGAYTGPSSPAPSSPNYSYQITGPNTVVITKTSGAGPTYTAFPEIVAKGKYRLSLKTGDDFTGRVESRNDSSLVFETTEGKPYSFKFSLIQSCQVIEVPSSGPGTSSLSPSSGFSREPVSYDELKNRASANPAIEIRMASGASFKGRLISINDEELKMDVGGSLIPFAKDVVREIFVLPNAALQKNDAPPQSTGKPQGLLETPPASPASGFDDALARYAKPLSCPNNMVIVDLPPGRTSTPFLKVCIDKYEYPDRSGVTPQAKISLDEARSLCEQQGKRLCTEDEWKWACSGLEGRVYPYGSGFIEGRCNNDTRVIDASGSRVNCVSPFGAYDMAGNIFEWVTASNGKPALMGGPYSKCQNVSYAQNGDAKPQSGVRCCKSN
jgi:hypothetical protein